MLGQLLDNQKACQQLEAKGYPLVDVLAGNCWRRTYLGWNENRSPRSLVMIREFTTQATGPLIWQTAAVRFERELELLVALPPELSAAPLLEWFELDQSRFLIREYVAGQSLAETPTTPWSEAAAIALIRSVVTVLVQSHAVGIIHGNLHPGNLVQRHPDQRIVLTDFGPLKRYRSEPTAFYPQQNPTGRLGRLAYLAPEQLQGKLYPSSDLYSLGLIAIQLLTGRQPWSLQVEDGLPHWQSCVAISEGLKTVLAGMIEPVPQRRWASAQALLDQLDTLIGVMPSVAPAAESIPAPEPDPEPAPDLVAAVAEPAELPDIWAEPGLVLESESGDDFEPDPLYQENYPELVADFEPDTAAAVGSAVGPAEALPEPAADLAAAAEVADAPMVASDEAAPVEADPDAMAGPIAGIESAPMANVEAALPESERPESEQASLALPERPEPAAEPLALPSIDIDVFDSADLNLDLDSLPEPEDLDLIPDNALELLEAEISRLPDAGSEAAEATAADPDHLAVPSYLLDRLPTRLLAVEDAARENTNGASASARDAEAMDTVLAAAEMDTVLASIETSDEDPELQSELSEEEMASLLAAIEASKPTQKSRRVPVMLTLSASAGGVALLAWANSTGKLTNLLPQVESSRAPANANDLKSAEPVAEVAPTPPIADSETSPSFAQAPEAAASSEAKSDSFISRSADSAGGQDREQQAEVYFEQARQLAKAREFTQALIYLEAIPQDVRQYPEVQRKIAEYRQKREVYAKALLVAAYKQAQAKNFAQALTYLKEISPGTEAYATAQQKIPEYTQKQQLLAQESAQ